MEKLLPVVFWLMVLAGIAGVVLAFINSAGKGGKGSAGSYRRRDLMTQNEAEFFGRLIVAFPDHYVFPQVAMSAVLEASSSLAKKAHSDRLKIAQQRIDYVITNKQLEIVVVVELDDRTHSRVKDQLRDSRLEQASIRTVRFQSKSKPTVEAIRTAVLGQPPAAVAMPQTQSAPA